MEEELILLSWAKISIFSCPYTHGTTGSWVFRLWDLHKHLPLRFRLYDVTGFLGTPGCRESILWNLDSITAWDNSYNKFHFIYTCIYRYPIGSVSPGNPNKFFFNWINLPLPYWTALLPLSKSSNYIQGFISRLFIVVPLLYLLRCMLVFHWLN